MSGLSLSLSLLLFLQTVLNARDFDKGSEEIFSNLKFKFERETETETETDYVHICVCVCVFTVCKKMSVAKASYMYVCIG